MNPAAPKTSVRHAHGLLGGAGRRRRLRLADGTRLCQPRGAFLVVRMAFNPALHHADRLLAPSHSAANSS
jgi:hypothetical protein